MWFKYFAFEKLFVTFLYQLWIKNSPQYNCVKMTDLRESRSSNISEKISNEDSSISNGSPEDRCCVDSFMREESNSSVAENMDVKDFALLDVKEEISSIAYEKGDVSAVSVKEEMHSDVSSELNECSLDRVNDSLPRPSGKEDQECLNESVTPFCFVDIKREVPGGYGSDPESNRFTEEYLNDRERASDEGVLASNGKANANLSRLTCNNIKMESEESIESRKSDIETSDDSSVCVDIDEKLDSNSVVHKCDMGHSSNEFIRGIECQQFPILCVKREEKTDNHFVEISNKPASNTSGLRRRTMEHSELEKDISFSCSETQESLNSTQCDSQIALKITRNRHLASHSRYRTVSDESKFSFRNRRAHTEEKPFACVFCRAKFDRKGALEKHTRTHTGEKPFSCDRCEGSFSTKDGLVNHRRIHTGEKPFKCPTCDVSFTRKSDLVKHMRIHTGERPFKCVTCQVSFTQKSHLVIHARIHTGEKPFRCEICKSTFTSKHSLVNHTRIHTGETPYTCVVCKLSYGAKRNLVRHMRAHTGEKPFTCDTCEASFRDKRQLANHTRTHT